MKEIEDLYTYYYPVQDEQLRGELIRLTSIRRLKKHEYIMHQEEEDTRICFLRSGVCGAYEIYPDGRTIWLSIVDQPSRIIVGGLGPNDPYSPVNVIMLTPGMVFTICMEDIMRLQNEYPEVISFYNRILLKEYETQWQIKNMLYMDAAEDRYEWFLANHPGTIDKISHKCIASYLHMSPVTLSRVRNKAGI